MSGKLPEGWREAKLGDLCRIEIGGTPSRDQPKFWSNKDLGHPWVSIADLRTANVERTKEFISDLGVANSNVKLVPQGTVMMSFKLTIGRTAIAGRDLYTNEAIAAFFPNSDLENEFLFYALPHAAGGADTDQAIKGATLNKSKLRDLSVRLPPLDEQRRIAEVLRSVDEAISTAFNAARQAVNTFNCVIASLFEPFATASGGAETKTAPLSEFCNRITYGFTNPMPTTDIGPWMITALNIKNGRIEYETARHTSLSAYDALTDKSRPQIGAVLVTKDGTLGRVAVVDQQDICVNQSVAVLDPRPECLNSQFLSYLLQSKAGQVRMLADSGGGSVKHIYITKLGAMHISVPSYEAQHAIADQAIKCASAVESADASLRQLRQLRASIATDLLSGHVRVPA